MALNFTFQCDFWQIYGMLESMKIEITYYWYIKHINKHVMFDYHIFISIDKFLCKSSI